MENETVKIEKKEIVRMLKDLEYMVVSLDRIGATHVEVSKEIFNKYLSDFIIDWDVTNKLSSMRSFLSSFFSEELGDDDMDELEREMQDVQYWSVKNRNPN